MKKKLALMAVLKQDKPVFIFDELFNGLNLGSGRAPELIIQKLKEKEKTIFISFHVLAPRLTLCNGICLLRKGQFVKSCQQQDFAAANKYLFAAFSKQAGDIISASI
jgi:ABC-2 type transport system ATP-binding protein